MSERGTRVDPSVYWTPEYNTKERTCSYWHQVDEILRLEASTVLEVGPGPGIVTGWLRMAGVEVTTLDTQPEIGADVVGSVSEIPLEDGSYDAVLCSQVLEHMPIEVAAKALSEMRRVARKAAVISLPDTRPYVGKSYPLYYGYYAQLVRDHMPKTRRARIRALLSGRLRLRDYLFARWVPAEWGLGNGALELARPPVPHGPWHLDPLSDHYYEIGMAGYPIERITDTISGAGWTIDRDFRVPENPWHHFFALV
jgi:SAM-dependent methyltransferase